MKERKVVQCPKCGVNVVEQGFTTCSILSATFMPVGGAIMEIAHTHQAPHSVHCLSCDCLLNLDAVDLMRVA